MSTKDDGGPAFPRTNEQFRYGTPATGDAWPGLSLRDWFAGQALAGLLANSALVGSVEHFAKPAYAAADAILAERKKRAEE